MLNLVCCCSANYILAIIQAMKQLIFLSLILPLALLQTCKKLHFVPMPKQITCGEQTLPLQDPCNILFYFKAPENSNQHIKQLISFQMKHTLACAKANVIISSQLQLGSHKFDYKIQVNIDDPQLKSVFRTVEEKYLLQISKNGTNINALTYVGFVRGLQTFMQAIRSPRHKTKPCSLENLPLLIKDVPAFAYRGLMIDSSRHFLPLKLIYETIDAMMYNKMNILHWHIVDEDSFPLILDSHPEIAKHASYSPQQTYTTKEARQIVEYGKRRGVRIVPELDTPGHAASWGLAPQNQGVACTFGQGFMGPLDVTLHKTYKLIGQVFAQIFDIFPDPMVHLGGDEVVLTCLANKTEFVLKQGISQQQIQRHYRKKQHKILQELDPTKKFIYWMNNNDIQIQKGDVVHWWGGSMPATNNEVILSQYGPFYLDMGVGNYLGVGYGSYLTWMDLYSQDIGKMVEAYSNKQNVLGAEVCLWSELSNQYIHHMKIWIRSSAFAQRVWTTEQFNPKPDVLGRIAAHQQLMNRRGIPTSGATSQQCETHPEYC